MIPYAMLYTVAAGLPILIAALALSALLRRHGKPGRGVWLCALALAFVLPGLALLSQVGQSTGSAASIPTGVIGLPEIVAIPVEATSLDVGSLVLIAWLGVSTMLALRWAVASVRLARAARSWLPGTIDGVPVHVTGDVGPAVAGVLRPRVLAPSWLHALAPRERSLILMHEQEHVRALDPVLIAITRIAQIAAPWNPVVWMLSSRLVRAVELDCDRRVLRRSSDVAAYGRTLIAVSSRRPGRILLAAAFAESEAPLRGRILAMTTPSRNVSIVAVLGSMVIGAVLLVSACEIPVPAVDIEDATEPTPASTAFDTPPDPPSPPPSTTAPEEAGAPKFTPMSVRPSLLNADEVRKALLRAYPAMLRDAGIGGAATMWMHIDESGAVDATRVAVTSGHAALDQAAAEVARAMRFSPAKNRDQAVATWVQVPVRFQAIN